MEAALLIHFQRIEKLLLTVSQWPPVLPRWLPSDMNSSQLVQFSLKKISTDGDKKIPREKNKTGEVLLKVG